MLVSGQKGEAGAVGTLNLKGIKLDATDSRGFSKLRSSYTLNFSVQVTAPITVRLS